MPRSWPSQYHELPVLTSYGRSSPTNSETHLHLSATLRRRGSRRDGGRHGGDRRDPRDEAGGDGKSRPEKHRGGNGHEARRRGAVLRGLGYWSPCWFAYWFQEPVGAGAARPR